MNELGVPQAAMNSGQVVVHVCLDDQPIESAERLLKFYVDDTTTFSNLRTQAAKSVQQPEDRIVIKDAFGAIWPPSRLIKEEIARLPRAPVLRLTLCV